MEKPMTTVNKSTKSGWIALLLGVFLGVFGVHRFYVGKIGTGLLMLITLGGFGIWLLTDLIVIISNKFEDKQGNTLLLMQNPSSLKKGIMGVCVVFLEIVIGVGLFFIFVITLTSGLIKPIQNQLDALRHGDIAMAYAHTSVGFQQTVSLEQFKKMVHHYAALNHNASYSWSKRAFQNDKGFVRALVISKEGLALPIEYRLIKEKGQWKISGFILNPSPTQGQPEVESNTSFGVSAEKRSDAPPAPSPVMASTAYSTYEDKRARFSINYPTAWDIRSKKSGQLFITGKKGAASYYSFITIHTIPSKKIGGKFSSAKGYVMEFKKQMANKFANVTFLKEGEAELPRNPKEFQGEYVLFTFTHRNQVFKRMDFVIARKDGLAFYDWSYTSPEKQFNQDLPIAKTVYESWVIQ